MAIPLRVSLEVNSIRGMLVGLLAAHLVGVAAAGLLGRRSMRKGLIVAAAPPLATTVWTLFQLAGDSDPVISELQWVEGLGLSLRFNVDSVALLMTLLVSGIGALVFIYSTGYFGPAAKPDARFAASLLAFSGSMLGLVWADSVWTLFIFWEFTSITSFLLVGHRHIDEAVRTAARRALMITGAGGLALLAGLLLLVRENNTTVLDQFEPATGTVGAVAAVLILLGAATKSAQVPFHVWLPGAMAAPTPVSAYLHSATMVKAGVFLMAVMGPVFADTAIWKTLGATLGIASMLWGGIGALRHRDAKLILAWGTVSQLGLLVTLFSIGTPKAVFAGIAILLAHALFKATLFLVVGEIDIRTGTRDIAELGGLWRSMPLACAAAGAAGLSMAGAPPLLGFMAKEAAIEAVLGLKGAERIVFASAVIVGSVLTVAYTVRFLVSVFGPGPATPVKPSRLAMTAPAALLATAGLAGYIFASAPNRLVSNAAVELNAAADSYKLIAWPGLKTAFVVSLGILAVGSILGMAVTKRGVQPTPNPVGATRADATIDGVLSIAPWLTARVQHGSLPVYIATMTAVAAVATIPFLAEFSNAQLEGWNNPIEPFLAVVIVGSAIAGTFVDSRLGAALALGAVGLGMSALFVSYGAPDLALTQLLVETIIVVGFVLGLGRLRQRFPTSDNTWKTVRMTIAGLGGVGVTLALASAASAPAGSPPLADITEQAVQEGGGKNLVNVILTDLRALDTLGEVVVLATVAIGMLALARVNQAEGAA